MFSSMVVRDRRHRTILISYKLYASPYDPLRKKMHRDYLLNPLYRACIKHVF